MQKKHRPRRISVPLTLTVLLLAAAFALFPPPAAAQSPLPLEEDFNYGQTGGTLVEVSDGLWTAHSDSGTSGFVEYDHNTSLYLSGYPSSGIGGSATVSRSGSEDVNRRFVRPAAGDLYVAALMRLSSAGGNYFFHLKDATLVNYPAKLWARNDGLGHLEFGFSNGELASWSAQDFAFDVTYLVVIKYNLGTGASALYILDSHSPTEPATPLLEATGAAVPVEAVAMRQTSFSPVTPDATLDGIRIATAWLEAVGAPIHVTKAAPDVVAPEQVFTYTITTTNQADLDLTDLIITDTVPANATFLSAADGGSFDGDSVQWTYAGPLAVGASVVRTFQVTASATDGVEIVNDDYGASAGNWPTVGTGNPVTTSVRYPPPADLVVIKSGPALAIPGETMVYTLVVSNTSVSDAEDVVLTDRLSANVTYVADDLGPWSNPSAGVYAWELGTVPAGAGMTYHLTATVKTALAWGTVLTNEAEVSTSTRETDLADNGDDATTLVYEVLPIGEARQRVGQTIMIEGTVTAEPGVFVDSRTNRKLYMEDGTAGILVYRYGGLSPVARSHRVRVLGVVQVASGETEIVPASTAHVMDLGPATPVLPAQVTTGGVDESVEGELVEIWGEIVAKPAPYRLDVDDGTGIVQVYRYINLAFANDPNYIDTSPFEIGNHIQAAGVSLGLEAEDLVIRQILPRGPGDLDEDFVVTFIYRDVEDVVWPGEEVVLVGDFNGWDPEATPLSADATGSVFSTTLILEEPAWHYRYVIKSGGEEHWDWLNTLDRSASLSGSTTLNDYRNVDVSWAQLLEPPTIVLNLGEASGPIRGQVGIPSVTDPAGEGRGVWAGVGYGTGSPGGWTWTAMSYADLQAGSYDAYVGALQPLASGVYSFAVRFDGNQGPGNPNAGWTFGDLDGTGLGDRFELIQTGVMTVTGPSLSVVKDVQPAADVARGAVVTYTLTLSNGGDGLATGVSLVDDLPAALSFGGWVQQSGATESGGTVQWSGDLEPGGLLTIAFRATVGTEPSLVGQTITNTASFTSLNGGSGSGSAAFAMEPPKRIYLPLVRRSSGP